MLGTRRFVLKPCFRCNAWFLSDLLNTTFCFDSQSQKILMDSSRDGSKPFVGLAFKLEVSLYVKVKVTVSLILHGCSISYSYN